MFRLKAQLLRFRPENGMQVVARGRVSLYEQRGELQLMAEYLEPQGAARYRWHSSSPRPNSRLRGCSTKTARSLCRCFRDASAW